MASLAGWLRKIFRSGWVAWASMKISPFLMFLSFRFATSDILRPVWRMISTIAAILGSVRTTSLRALYSIWERNLGAVFSILGCETSFEWSNWITP